MNIKACLYLALISFSSICLADSDLYKVEIVLFKRLDQESIPNEASLASSQQPTKSLTELNPEIIQTTEIPYQLLSEKQLQLSKEAKKLSHRKNMQVMLHIAWLQPMNSKRYTKPVHIFAGESLASDQENNTDVDYFHLPVTEPGQHFEFDGSIRVNRSNNFVINTQLIYTLAPASKKSFNFFNRASANNLYDNESTQYVINQSQSVRSNELHYFDHPGFGLLAMVTKLESP